MNPIVSYLTGKSASRSFRLLIKSVLFLLFLLLPPGCNDKPTDPPVPPVTKWEKIEDLSGIQVLDVKVLNDELYIAGRDESNRGVIYKSADAVNWQIVNPSVGDSLPYGVEGVDFYNGSLIAAGPGRPLYKITENSLVPLTQPLQSGREIIIDSRNNILVGGGMPLRHCTYITPDGISLKYDHLSVDPNGGCEPWPEGTQGYVHINKFLRVPGSDDILIANSFNYHFITLFRDTTIQCFPVSGLSAEEKRIGCTDMFYIGDTLIAAADTNLKYLDYFQWRNYGSPLPLTPLGDNPSIISTAYEDKTGQLFVSVSYLGILKLDQNRKWIPLNEGLTAKPDGYIIVDEINVFKDYLVLTYGTDKKWLKGEKGVYIYPLKQL